MAKREEEEVMATIRDLVKEMGLIIPVKLRHKNYTNGDYFQLEAVTQTRAFGFFNGTNVSSKDLDDDGWEICKSKNYISQKYWQWIYVGAGDKALHLTERFYTEEEAKDLSKKGLMGLKIVDRAHWTAIEYQE